MATVIINDMTDVTVDTELLTPEIIEAYLKDLQVVYIQTISWLLGYPSVIAKNNTKEEDNEEMYKKEQENLENLAKEKKKIENNLPEIIAKIQFFKSLL